jgi:DNA-binding GntR family transcriptional regulator
MLWMQGMDQCTSTRILHKVTRQSAFNFKLDRHNGRSLVRQLAARVQTEIEGGRLRPGAELPSLREMSRLVGVSPFTVFAAYDLLASLHYVSAREGAGYVVLERAKGAVYWPGAGGE